MCTVSFVPRLFPDFILTSNRDETIKRGLSSLPQQFKKEGIDIICPRDPLANGTWIAASERGNLVCLLNGAFKPHKHRPPYRMSRGIVVLDSVIYQSSEEFAAQYDLTGIEPFTMVMVRNREVPVLHELRWDGKEKYFKQLETRELHLWSSATLYPDEVIAEKERVFKKYFQELKEVSSEVIMEIHSKFLYEDWVKPPKRVEEVNTLSITSVEWSPPSLRMLYRDLVRKDLPLAMVGFPGIHSSS